MARKKKEIKHRSMTSWGFGKVQKTRRTTESDGRGGNRVMWVEKKPEPIRDCECGAKYIKTRRGQKTCRTQKHV